MDRRISTLKLSFRELGADCFVWLPLTSIPVSEQFPINSLEQPALNMFPLAEWNAIDKFATDNQKYLGEIAQEHNEMGYFLLHCRDLFGIIGVDEFRDGRRSGRATIFNAHEVGNCAKDVSPTMLKLIYASVRLPWKEVAYAPGDLVDYREIYDAPSCEPLDD